MRNSLSPAKYSSTSPDVKLILLYLKTIEKRCAFEKMDLTYITHYIDSYSLMYNAI
jgi:hypothetical protein